MTRGDESPVRRLLGTDTDDEADVYHSVNTSRPYNRVTAITATDHPLERLVNKRPEVYETRVFECAEYQRVIVTFDGWAMPDGFAEDYDIEVEDFYVRDPRPLWKQVVGMKPRARLEVTFRREQGDLPEAMQDRTEGGSE